jgi:hypothetical protein
VKQDNKEGITQGLLFALSPGPENLEVSSVRTKIVCY